MSTSIDLYRPMQSSYFDQSALAQGQVPDFLQYLLWKTEDQAAYIPEKEDVRDEIIDAWKRIKARELAAAAAADIAQKAFLPFRTHVKAEMREKANAMCGNMDEYQAGMVEHGFRPALSPVGRHFHFPDGTSAGPGETGDLVEAGLVQAAARGGAGDQAFDPHLEGELGVEGPAAQVVEGFSLDEHRLASRQLRRNERSLLTREGQEAQDNQSTVVSILFRS